MIGDFPGVQHVFSTYAGPYEFPLAGGYRSYKITENNNPRPEDRVFFNYNYYSNALQSLATRSDLSGFTFGAEKTFCGGCASVELRLPFAVGLNADQTGTNLLGTEFGDVTLWFKSIIAQNCRNTLSSGLGIGLPTARSAILPYSIGTNTVFRNESVHLMPFVAWLYEPNCSWFVQNWAQLVFDTSGYGTSTPGRPAERVYDQNLLYLDSKIGRWVYRNPCARFVSGIAPTIELHYTATITDSPIFEGRRTLPLRSDVLDLTAGVQFQLGRCCDLAVAAAVPLTGTTAPYNRAFDAEIILQFNCRF